MSGSFPVRVATLIGILVLISPLWVLLKGGLPVTQYDGDALHLADIALRMADGQSPHIDFMTPLGILGFAPISAFLAFGFSLGMSFALAQATFALCAAPILFHTSISRLPPWTGLFFAFAVMAILTSYTHGTSPQTLAVSMHYNRWAWGLALCGFILFAVPSQRPHPILDGICLAVIFAGLALLKATFFVALAPICVLAIVLRRDFRTLLAGLVAGAFLSAVIVGLLGFPLLLGYAGDLFSVAGGTQRAQPGLPLQQIILSPEYLPMSLVALAGFVAFRMMHNSVLAVILLLSFAAFSYVTWQNFGNDPIWIIAVAALLATSAKGQIGRMKSVLGGLALAASIMGLPHVISHAGSGPRLLLLPTAGHVPLVPENTRLAGVTMPRLPAQLIRGRQRLNDDGAPYASVPDPRETPPLSLAGVDVTSCQVQTGLPSVLGALADDLSEDYSDGVFVADIISAHWLYAGAEPLPGGAPWNYGRLSGIENATYVLLPRCPVSVSVQRDVVKLLEASDLVLRSVKTTPRAEIFKILR